MWLFKTIDSLQSHLKKLQSEGKSIGFVPTMGALHRGHLRLLEECKIHADISVCSIFVNPTQFNDPGDLTSYPITIESDMDQLIRLGCDVLFLPDVDTVYPNGTEIKEKIDFGRMAIIAEGESRPGHFDGMAQVVERLLRIVGPEFIFMGQKDLQQSIIVKKLVELKNLKTQVVRVDTVREEDGLALSSRNVRLNQDQRQDAKALSSVLFAIRDKASAGTASKDLKKLGYEIISQYPSIELEYLELVSMPDMMDFETLEAGKEYAALIGVNVESTRLLDNVVFSV